MRRYQKQRTPTTPLDDLPDDRLTDALALIDYMRRTGMRDLSIAPGAATFAICWDLCACGVGSIEPDDGEFPNAMRFELRGGLR